MTRPVQVPASNSNVRKANAPDTAAPEEWAKVLRVVRSAVDTAYGTDPRHDLLARAAADAVVYDKPLPWSLGRHFGMAATQVRPRCPECGPGYRYGDEGCRHTPPPAAPAAGEGVEPPLLDSIEQVPAEADALAREVAGAGVGTVEWAIADLSDDRRPNKPWLPADDRDVSGGRVVLDPSSRRPYCVVHGAMHRIDPTERLYRCSECGVGARLTSVEPGTSEPEDGGSR